jgi:hypothetical protein
MRPPLKLSGIDQEHLQELYDQAKIARDELPYSDVFDELCRGFQDRTFKNAHPEQIYAAMLKYTRSSTNSAGEMMAVDLTEDQLKQLKGLLPRHAKGGKVLPYSDEFEAVLKEFTKISKKELPTLDFWRAILRSQGPKRRPPKRVKVATAAADEVEEDDGE